MSTAKKVIGILILLALIEFLAVMPDLGYTAEVEGYTIQKREAVGRLVTKASLNIVFNPFLYGITWINGIGHFNGNYIFTTTGRWYQIQSPTGDVALMWRNPTPTEIKEEAISRFVMEQFDANILFNIAILIIIGFARIYDVYLCIIASVLGFYTGGLVGAFALFVAVLLLAVYVKLKIWREGIFAKMVKFFLEEEIYPYEQVY